MKAYRTLRTVLFPAGTVLALDAQQAAPRAHVLYEMEPGVYTAKDSVMFKAGETIGLMAEPAKGDSGLEPAGEWEFSATAENAPSGDGDETDDPVETKPGKKAK